MNTEKSFSRLKIGFDQGKVLDKEFSWIFVNAILEGKISHFDECREFLPIEIGDVILKSVKYIEEQNYLNPSPFINDGLSVEERKERSKKLKHVYISIFNDMKAFFEEQSKS